MIIAERVLNIVDGDGSTSFFVRLHRPELAADGKAWGCRFEICWPDRPIDMTIWGEDAIQALDLAMKIIGVRLYVSGYHADGRLVWHEPGAGYGFPIVANSRDLLIGDDAKYQ